MYVKLADIDSPFTLKVNVLGVLVPSDHEQVDVSFKLKVIVWEPDDTAVLVCSINNSWSENIYLA